MVGLTGGGGGPLLLHLSVWILVFVLGNLRVRMEVEVEAEDVDAVRGRSGPRHGRGPSGRVGGRGLDFFISLLLKQFEV